MNFIKFESATEKERIRNELRNAREELIAKAKKSAEARAEREAERKLKGEDNWIHPSLNQKIDKLIKEHKSKKKNKEKKKSKKSKKDSKKKKKQKHSSSSSSESDSSSSEEEIIKKKKKKKQKFSSESSNSSSESEGEEEWVEKTSETSTSAVKKVETTKPSSENLVRDEWMTGDQFFLKTFKKDEKTTDRKAKNQIDSYDPSNCPRELNPHWKDGGKGLPTFQKPKEDDDGGDRRNSRNYSYPKKYSGNWRKNDASSTQTSRNYDRRDTRREDRYEERRKESTEFRSRNKKSRSRDRRSRSRDRRSRSRDRRSRSRSKESNSMNSSRNKSPEKKNKGINSEVLTDHQLNELGAKLIKAEIMGDDELAKELQEKLNKAREVRNSMKGQGKLPSKNKDYLSEQQMNELAAKIIKAEIQGDDKLANELQEKLDKAKRVAKNMKNDATKASQPSAWKRKERNSPKEEHILLTTTNSKGMTKPLSTHPLSHDPYGGRKGNKRKQKAETHIDGERVRFFPDDDRYDIKQMFEREKYTTGGDSDAQFAQIAGKHKNRNDDLEDIFADKVRETISDYDRDEKETKRAIAEHERYTKILESCEKCFDSPKMEKGLMVAMGTTAYLAIPYHEALQPGHCLIVPMQHITCSTQLDEDTWNEINEFRKALTRMFAAQSKDVVFFEIANYLHKKPHMVIHCIPSDHENFELAPMYFKKAIQESEYEWSTNKQLITLKEKDLRRSIPKGLPYFWVHFGMNLGFAHVIEDHQNFKPNFAQEIIGGMLNLDPKAWRKPRKEHKFVEKVKKLYEMWRPYDFTS